MKICNLYNFGNATVTVYEDNKIEIFCILKNFYHDIAILEKIISSVLRPSNYDFNETCNIIFIGNNEIYINNFNNFD